MEHAADLCFRDVEVGAKASFRHVLTESDVVQFAALSGDFNPLHLDRGYAATTTIGHRIVHGMFLASLFSRLVGMHLPGRRCLYLSQSLDFLRPARVGEEVEVIGEVTGKQQATRTLVIRTEIFIVPHVLAVRGKAIVKVLD